MTPHTCTDQEKLIREMGVGKLSLNVTRDQEKLIREMGVGKLSLNVVTRESAPHLLGHITVAIIC